MGTFHAEDMFCVRNYNELCNLSIEDIYIVECNIRESNGWSIYRTRKATAFRTCSKYKTSIKKSKVRKYKIIFFSKFAGDLIMPQFIAKLSMMTANWKALMTRENRAYYSEMVSAL